MMEIDSLLRVDPELWHGPEYRAELQGHLGGHRAASVDDAVDHLDVAPPPGTAPATAPASPPSPRAPAPRHPAARPAAAAGSSPSSGAPRPGLSAAVSARARRRYVDQGLPRSLVFAHVHLLGGPSCPPVRCPTKSWGGRPSATTALPESFSRTDRSSSSAWRGRGLRRGVTATALSRRAQR